MPSLERRILDIEKAQAAAFNARDLDGVLEPFDDGVVCFSSTQQRRVEGKAALARTFRYYWRQGERIRYSIAQPRVQRFGDVAVASFYWTVRIEKGGRPRRVAGRGTHVFARRGGAWKIVHEHFSRAHS